MASFHAAEELPEVQIRPSGVSREQVLAAIEEGLADIETGRVTSHEDLRAELEAEFGPLDV
jgi:predicted transcriptional regulator